jgi:hypothetical protein
MVLNFQTLNDNCPYVVDLLQLYDGVRMLRFREVAEQQDPEAVFSTPPIPGCELRRMALEHRPIPLVGGGSFVMDENEIWMTDEEASFLQANQTSAALHDPNAPWVNHLPPKFVSS